MKKVGLVALLVVAGLVSLGALLMVGAFRGTPEASATIQKVDLVAGRSVPPHVVGDVDFHTESGGVHVLFTADPGEMIDEVHVCISERATCDDSEEPNWTPPGRCPWKVEPSSPQPSIEVIIPWDDLPVDCNDVAWIQAHAAMEDGQTAYGGKFKGSFCATVYCCW